MSATSTALDSARSAPRRAALIAGAATVLMAPLGMFGNLTVLGLVAAGVEGMAAQAQAGRPLLALTVVSFLLVVVLDVVVAWALARYFAARADGLPTLAAWFRVAYAAVLAAAVGQLAVAARPDAAEGAIVAAVQGFGTTWQLGLVVFAAHLVLLGWLIVRETSTPKLLGVVVLAAGAAYALDGIVRLLLPGDSLVLAVLTVVVAVTSIVGELGFAIWLLVRGGLR